ncbi:MAG: TonB-dependent receptor [Clostridium sp.]|nr:TonB-dependent receptor [Clostridium sp.]
MKSFRIALVSLFAMIATAIQAQTVTGNVKDSTGEGVIGATVMEKGTKNGTITDMDGNFTINVAKGKTLVFSYIGMKEKQVKVTGDSPINVVMEDDNTTLNDVVVIGYGTVRKKDLTGAVASVNAKQIENVPVSNVSEALTGKMAGVNITTTEGSPDADIKIRVRGGGSLSQDNSPLYIVDGFEVSSISDIAPSEIESIDVLKDASSTAIYGARGANGVVIVTTKSGKEGKVQVAVNSSLAWKKVSKYVKTMSPYDYAYYQYELGNANYGNFDDLDIWKSVEGTDYQDELFGRTGLQKQFNANVSGGSKDVKFNVGYNHIDEESIMIGSGYKKNNINAKINANINQWLKFDFQARLAHTRLDGLSGGADTNESNASGSIVANTITYRPVNPLSESADDDDETSSSSMRSPLQRITDTYKKQERFQQSYNGALTWKPWKGWTFRTDFGYTWKYNNTEQVWGSNAAVNSKYGYNGHPQGQWINQDNKNWKNSNTITYDTKKLFTSNDHLNVMVGQEWSYSETKTRTNTSVNFPESFTTNDVLSYTSTGLALDNEVTLSEPETMLSYFGRINYTLADKYLLTATFRTDGSSKFGKDNRWGFFPSVALAWRISDEAFMQGASSWLSNLKARLSFGTAGNNRISSGSISMLYSLASNTSKAPYFNEVRASMLAHSTRLYNPNLKWETTVTRNFGIDYGFFRGRLNGSLDLYWNTTSDLLMQVTIPSQTGYRTQYQNFGQTSNKGVELTLNAVLADTKNFGLNFNANIAYNSMKIDKLERGGGWQSSSWSGSTISLYEDFLIEEGGKLGELYGYKTNGFYTVYDPATGTGDLMLNAKGQWVFADPARNDNPKTGLKPGAIKYEYDENGEMIKSRLGNTIAPVQGGFGFDGRWKNFDFNVFFNYSLGNKIVNGSKLAASFNSGSKREYNLVNDFAINNRYTYIDPVTGQNLSNMSAGAIAEYEGGAEAIMARLNEINAGANIWNPASMSTMYIVDYAVENASFLRLQNVTIGYNLPKNWLRNIFIQSVRVYVTGYNLLTFTDYSGYDPEVDTSSKKNPMCPGIDYAAYPKSRTFTVGLNVTF